MVDSSPSKTRRALLCLALAAGAVLLIGCAHPLPPETAQTNACINNLRLLDAAQQQWALEHHKSAQDTATAANLKPYLGSPSGDVLPICPDDPKHSFATSYDLHTVSKPPTCKIHPQTHVLP